MHNVMYACLKKIISKFSQQKKMKLCMSSDCIFNQVNEYPWIAAFDFNGVDGTSPGGCAASLVRFHSSKSVNQTQVSKS